MAQHTNINENLALHGREVIKKGSKSFALASRLFGKEMQADVQMLYAWCRYCDDRIDGQELGVDAPDADLSDGEQARRLDDLSEKTHRIFAGEDVGQADFDGFALVVARHKIPKSYALDLLSGFMMDVKNHSYDHMDDLFDYCYGVAGAVGIMMAIVMGVDARNDHVLDRACDLGLAFQLTNICRDLVDDAKAGRVYLPTDLLERHGLSHKAEAILDLNNRALLARAAMEVLDLADIYYKSASEAFCYLPPRCAGAIGAARNIYRDIGHTIRLRGAHAWDERVYTSKPRKTWLALTGLVSSAPQSLFFSSRPLNPRTNLWQRPLPDDA